MEKQTKNTSVCGYDKGRNLKRWVRVDQYCVATKSGNKFFAALLVELDINDSTFVQSTPHLPIRYDPEHLNAVVQVGARTSCYRGDKPREYEIADTTKTKLKFNTSDTRLVMVFDQSRIGAVRYFGIVLQQDNSEAKILNVSLHNHYNRTIADIKLRN